MRLIKHKLFYKYLIPYIAIMMIPTIFFGIFINYSLLSRLREQYVDNTTQSLNQFMDLTEKNILQLEMIRDHILSSREFVPTLNLRDITASREIIKELKKYTISNGLLVDIALYLEGDNYIYTSGSTYSLDAFFSGRQYYQSWSSEDFRGIIQNPFNQYIRPEEKILLNGTSYDTLSVLYPVQLRNRKAYLLFLLDTSHFNIEEDSSSYFITDDTDKILYSFLTDEIDGKGIVHNDFLDYEILNNQKEYLFSSIASGKIGWKYHKVTPTQKVYGDFFQLQNRFYGIIGIIIIAGGAIIYLGMTINYNPLKRLRKLTEGIVKNEEGQDMIHSIEDTLTHLAHENSELKGKDGHIAKNHFLHLILKGRIASKEEFDQQIEQLRLEDLNNPYYCVFMIRLKDRQTNLVHDKIDTQVLERLVNKLVSGYIKEHSENGKFVFLGSLESNSTLSFSHTVLDVQDLLQKELGLDVALACSSICNQFDELPQCYMEAALAIDYSFVKGNNCVIDSSQLALNEKIGAVYPQKLFDSLNYQMKKGDIDKIEEILDEIINYIKTSDLPLYYTKSLCYQLINTISSMIEHLNYKLSTTRSKLSYGTVLADFDTAEELMEAVRNISINICSFIREDREESEFSQINIIKDYIDANALDINFSVQNMANEFQMALPTISSFFKTHCNTTIIDYVTEIRMNYAKQLLLEERYTLKEIVERVGYLNTSSFIRKFKTIYGLTPGQYVKYHKEKK